MDGGYGGPLDHEERPDEVILAAQARTEEAERPRSQFEQQLEYADNEDEQKRSADDVAANKQDGDPQFGGPDDDGYGPGSTRFQTTTTTTTTKTVYKVERTGEPGAVLEGEPILLEPTMEEAPSIQANAVNTFVSVSPESFPEPQDDDEMVAATASEGDEPYVKTATIVQQGGPDEENSQLTHDVPYVQTENTTISFERDQPDNSLDDSGMLVSAQTLTSEGHTTTTTTHITRTVKGDVTETRVEKKIIIQGDADINKDELLAEAIAEEKRCNPDFTITKVVIHKEGEETNGDVVE